MNQSHQKGLKSDHGKVYLVPWSNLPSVSSSGANNEKHTPVLAVKTQKPLSQESTAVDWPRTHEFPDNIWTLALKKLYQQILRATDILLEAGKSAQWLHPDYTAHRLMKQSKSGEEFQSNGLENWQEENVNKMDRQGQSPALTCKWTQGLSRL